ncbi:MAG: serine/threonine protein kinase [Polyangiaceae bacterium]|nr:serine/threonine protein kinase [Polyangiaceae bacterium]
MGRTTRFAQAPPAADPGSARLRVRPAFLAKEPGSGRWPSEAPLDVTEQAAGRVALVAAAVVAVSLLEAAVAHLWPLLTRSDYPTESEKLDLVGNAVLEVVSLAAIALTRNKRLAAVTRLRIGGAYLLVVAALVSLTDHADHYWAGGHRQHGVPWVTALILVFPVLVPMRPLRALVVGLLMAATSPLAMLAHSATLGAPKPDLAGLLDGFPFLFAFVAAFSAKVVHQLGREVGRARQLGAYTLETKLGSGGMGEVWVASHRFLARRAAVKLIQPPDATVDAQTALERFHREAQATARLTCAHTVRLYDYGTSEDGRLFYAMELLDGTDLDALVKLRGPQPPERVVHWLRQICQSLGEAHDAGLVHRDIKPSNLYVCRYGREDDCIKVLDFGLVHCRQSQERTETSLTAGDCIVGTPAYMAPELAAGKSPIDARVDLYSLGCVAYFLLTGKTVFDAPSPIEIMIQHVQKPPSAPSEASSLDVPAELDRIVLACLAKSPDERPQSADELAELLDGCVLPTPWTQKRARAWWDENATLRRVSVV